MEKQFRYEVDFTGAVLRVYGAHPDNYIAVCTIQIAGDTGTVMSLHGDDFFEAVARKPEVLFVCGIKYLRFEMRPATLRALKWKAQDRYIFEDEGILIKNGRELRKIRIQQNIK